MSSGADLLGGQGRTHAERRLALQRAGEHVLFGIVPVVATILLLAVQFRLHVVAVDFRIAYWQAGYRVLHGISPYAASHSQIIGGAAFVYPALSAVLLAPFGLISRGPAEVIYMLLCVACIPGTLRVLNVRDWRVYGLAMLWYPLFSGWQTANVTLPLMLLVALAWRHRDRPVVTGVLIAAAISIKPFMWPFGLWLLATRRWKAAAWALASGITLNLLAWSLVGFNEFSTFVHISSEDTSALWKQGYGLPAVAHHMGMDRFGGEVLLVLLALVVAAWVVHTGAVKRRDASALVLAAALALVASPLVWAHYFSVLLIPVALRRPRLAPVWALPVLMWPMPPRAPVHGWQEVLAWGLTAAVLVGTRQWARRAPSPSLALSTE